jgi:hypothetical protein
MELLSFHSELSVDFLLVFLKGYLRRLFQTTIFVQNLVYFLHSRLRELQGSWCLLPLELLYSSVQSLATQSYLTASFDSTKRLLVLIRQRYALYAMPYR